MRSETETTDETRTSTTPAGSRVAVAPPGGLSGHMPRMSRALVGDMLLVFVIALAVRLVWALVLPPWQGFDETEHFSYVNHIAEQGALPHPGATSGYPPYSRELQSSLDNTSFYPFVRWQTRGVGLIPALDPADYAAARQFALSGAGRYDAGDNRATAYPPLYYLILTVPDRLLHGAPITSRLFALRATSALFGALACLFAYLTAYDLFRGRRWGWYVGLAVAFMAAFAQLSASVNNDALMNALAAALIWLTVHMLVHNTVRITQALATIVCGILLVLTKPTALLVLVVALIVIVGIVFASIWRRTGSRYHRIALVTALVIALVAIPLVVLMYRDVPSVRDFVATAPFLRTLTAPSPASVSVGTYLRFLGSPSARPYLWQIYAQFWGWFGWGAAILPPVALYLTIPIGVVGIVGSVLRAIHRPAERRVWLLFLALVLGQVIVLLGVEYRTTFATDASVLGLEGRYFYPVLIPILLAIIAGWAHLCRDSVHALRGATLAMFALQLVGWSTVLTRYYDVMIGWIR